LAWLAKVWWDLEECDTTEFDRLTQIEVLRLLGFVNGQPLGMSEAWVAYDQLFSDVILAGTK
jgi:hypothetical protein